MKKRLRVAVLFGGRSGEHEVSLVSARSVIKALNPKKYEVIPIKISKTGGWPNGVNLVNGKPKIDVVFPVLHGPFGEDGTIQGLLEVANIPYVGCGVLASSAGMDKLMSKIIFKAHNLPQVDFLHFSRNEIEKDLPDIKKLVKKKIGYPCFIKPSNMGSSIGISKVKNQAGLTSALKLAAKFDSVVIVEKAVNAREIECSVLGNENPTASIIGEIIPSREFYDFYSKYVDGASRLIIPAKIPAKSVRELQRIAVQAFKAIHGSGMGRIDFLVDKRSGKVYLNEINTIPGFTSISMYPKLWAASGIPYPKLIDRLIKLAIERHGERQKNAMSFESGSDWYKG